MNKEKFEELLDQHGADLTRWKEEDARAAERLMGEDEAALDLFVQMQTIEAELGQEIEPPSHGVDAIMAEIAMQEMDREAAAANKSARRSFRLFGLDWLGDLLPGPGYGQVTIATACIGIGIFLADTLPPPGAPPEPVTLQMETLPAPQIPEAIEQMAYLYLVLGAE